MQPTNSNSGLIPKINPDGSQTFFDEKGQQRYTLTKAGQQAMANNITQPGLISNTSNQSSNSNNADTGFTMLRSLQDNPSSKNKQGTSYDYGNGNNVTVGANGEIGGSLVSSGTSYKNGILTYPAMNGQPAFSIDVNNYLNPKTGTSTQKIAYKDILKDLQRRSAIAGGSKTDGNQTYDYGNGNTVKIDKDGNITSTSAPITGPLNPGQIAAQGAAQQIGDTAKETIKQLINKTLEGNAANQAPDPEEMAILEMYHAAEAASSEGEGGPLFMAAIAAHKALIMQRMMAAGQI